MNLEVLLVFPAALFVQEGTSLLLDVFEFNQLNTLLLSFVVLLFVNFFTAFNHLFN